MKPRFLMTRREKQIDNAAQTISNSIRLRIYAEETRLALEKKRLENELLKKQINQPTKED